MRRKFKSVFAVVLCSLGLVAFAVEPSVTINEVKSIQPWDSAKGTITVDYSLANIDAAKMYKVAFDITANGVTKGVTNAAVKLVEGRQSVFTNDTVSLFGEEIIDNGAKVRISLIAAGGAVQLWANGPYWAEANLGEPESHDPAYPAEYGALYKFGKADAAVKSLLGDEWRVPTIDEFAKLINKNGEELCSNVWTTNGIIYLQFFGKTTGYEDKSIVLPTAGMSAGDGRTLINRGGAYWSSELGTQSYGMDTGKYLYFAADTPSVDLSENFIDFCTMSVRPVRDTPVEEEVIAIAEAEFVLAPPKSVAQIELEKIFDVENTATMVESVCDAEGNPTGLMVTLGQDYGPLAFSNDFGDVTIDLNGWTIKGTDGADGTTTTAGGNGGAAITVAGECGAAMGETFITVKDDSCVQLWENGPCFSVRNVGASKPQDYGYYFWWGDTVGYVRNEADNGWDAVDGSVSGFVFSDSNTKIETSGKSIGELYNDGNGYIDANSEDGKLKPEYDAATFYWGAPWRMPTKAELDALVENCTTEWTDDWEGTGKAGRIVKGRGDYESKSIFLPAAGYGINTNLNNPESYYGYCGYYWSSTPYSGNTGDAWFLKFHSDAFGEVYSYRFRGQPVRAVRGSEEVRPVYGPAAALIGGNGGDGNPAGKGSPAVVGATGAEVAVADPNGLVKKGADGLTFLPNVPYRAWNETTRQMEDRECADYELVLSDTREFEDGKWYVVLGETVIDGTNITVNGSANLILTDGSSLTIKNVADDLAAIEVTGNSRLTIYGQENGSGVLSVSGGVWGAGIGGGYHGAGGTVTINGGMVTANGGWRGAGIGGGIVGDGGTVTINGGTVTANGGENGAGIGGGVNGNGGTVTINGGAVTATGIGGGAGIGSGYCGAIVGAGGTVTIYGGTVTAKGGNDGSDIGCGYDAAGATVTIDGGSVKAETIVNAPTNGANAAVYCVTVECEGVESLGSGIVIGGLEDYGTNDIFAIDERIYLWLPNGDYRFTVGGIDYLAKVKDADTTAIRAILITPGTPLAPFETAEEATNAMAAAAISPSDDVAAALGSDAARETYRNMFELDVVPTSDGKWAVEAFLTPEDWTNVVLSARSATRQIPVADIAKLGLGDVLEKVPLTNCVPGFYYSLYDGSSLTSLKADINEINGNILCGPGTTVEIPVVTKPSSAAGFFTIGVLEIPTVYIPGTDYTITGGVEDPFPHRRTR